MSSPIYFVNQTNPEIFTATPRPGGLTHIDIPEKPNKLKENASRAKKQSLSQSTVNTSRSRSRTAAALKKQQSAKDTTAEPSRKSLLTITTAYKEPEDLDIDSCPREYKVKQIIAATPWSIEFDDYLDHSDESKRIPDPFQDSVDMLAMSLSVIMLLSRGYSQINETHLKWVVSYLDCIRDDFGKIPPNVQGILNHINQMSGGIKSFLDEDYEPNELMEGRTTSVRISSSPPSVSPLPTQAEAAE